MSPRNANGWMPWLLLAIVLVGGWMAWPRHADLPGPAPSATETVSAPQAAIPVPLPPTQAPAASPAGDERLPAFLPEQARDTIARIRHDGPFPHRQDGSVFGNREGHLPRKPRGWYREYTVETPGLDHRGARRIVTGGNPPSEWYYTSDHYDSFRRFDVPGDAP